MAQKTYTMDFVLNAVLNGGFNGVFTQAQQQFMRLGNEIKSLQRVQRDITSYQKQAQAVSNTSQKLQHLQAQQAKVREQIEALKSIQSQDSDEKARNRAQVAQLEREYLKYQQRIEDTQGAMEKQRQKMEDLGGKLQDAGVDMNALGEKSAELTGRLGELEAEQKRLNGELDNGGDKAKEFGEKGEAAVEAVSAALAAAGVTVALKEIANGFVACVDAASEFGSAMSAVEAISDANQQEMAALNAKAKETGLTTVYTAQQSANAMEYMAMAGWEAQNMLSGMSGMVNLAAAAGEDLANVSDIVTDNLTAFNMEADETAHFADVLAAAAANSNTNIYKMGESFKNSSAVAGALGYSIEDVAVGLGLMANNAVKGTRAGTALRNIFNGFVEGMTLTGQSFGEVEVSAINADGSVKGFMETIRELRGYFSQMTGAEKIQNAMDIAGLRGYNGLLAIVNATDADFEKLYVDINNCTGAAQRMAKIKLDNMKGDLTIAKSAWEGLTIAIGEQFEPELRALYQTGADVFNQGNAFVQQNPAVVKAITGLVAGVGAATTALTVYAAAKKVVAALNLAGMFTPGIGLAIAAVGAIGMVSGAMIGLNGTLEEMTSAAYEGRLSLEELTEGTKAAVEAMETARDTYEGATEDALSTAQAAEHYLDRLEQLERQGKRSSDVNSEYQNTLALLVQTMPELEENMEKTTDQYGRSVYAVNTSTNAIRANIQAIKDQAWAAASQDYLEEVYRGQVELLKEQYKNEMALAQAKDKKNAADQRAANIQREIANQEADYIRKQDEERAKMLKGEEYTPVVGPFQNTEAYAKLHDQLVDAQADAKYWGEQVDTATAALDGNAEAVAAAQNEIDLVTDAMERYSSAYEKSLGLTEDEIAALEALNPTIKDTIGNVTAMKIAYQEARDAAHESFSSQYNLWDEAAKRSAIAAGTIKGNLEGQEDYWRNYTADLDTLMEKVRSGEYDGLGEMIATIASDGSPEAVNAIAGLADATDAELKGAVQAWKDNKAAIDEAAQAAAEFSVDMETQTGNVVQMVEDMAADIENNMDLSAEAKAAALETISGYVEGLNAGLHDPALATALEMLQSKINGALATKKRPLMRGVYSDWWSDHYAGGTTNAAPGWALVGEEGPELVRMRGGEAVFPAAKTAEMLTGGGGGTGPVKVYLTVQGSVTPEVVPEIERAVRSALEDIEEEKRRRGYT